MPWYQVRQTRCSLPLTIFIVGKVCITSTGLDDQRIVGVRRSSPLLSCDLYTPPSSATTQRHRLGGGGLKFRERLDGLAYLEFCRLMQCVGSAIAMATWLCGCLSVCLTRWCFVSWRLYPSQSSFPIPNMNPIAQWDTSHRGRHMEWRRYAMLGIRRASPLPSSELKWRYFTSPEGST